MSIPRFSLAVLLVTAVTSPSFAEVENPGKVVCKSEQQNGTRIPKRTCMTAAEWDALAENAKRTMADQLRTGRPWSGDNDAQKPGTMGTTPY
jgi:hypothetical protein